MFSLGMDIGASTVKLVLLKDKEIEKQWMEVHHGSPFVCLKKGLSTLELAMDTPVFTLRDRQQYGGLVRA